MKRRAPWSAWTPQRKNEAVACYKTGVSMHEVAARLKTSVRHVWRVLNEVGAVRNKQTAYLGAGNPSWKGGRQTDKSGYVLLYQPKHPRADSGGYVREHRLLMEQKLGRLLLPHEVVHHIDGDVANNNPDNLKLHSSNSDHLREELKGHTPNWSEDGKRRIQASADRKKEAAKRKRLGL